jgi:hypothetical protein
MTNSYSAFWEDQKIPMVKRTYSITEKLDLSLKDRVNSGEYASDVYTCER